MSSQDYNWLCPDCGKTNPVVWPVCRRCLADNPYEQSNHKHHDPSPILHVPVLNNALNEFESEGTS